MLYYRSIYVESRGVDLFLGLGGTELFGALAPKKNFQRPLQF